MIKNLKITHYKHIKMDEDFQELVGLKESCGIKEEILEIDQDHQVINDSLPNQELLIKTEKMDEKEAHLTDIPQNFIEQQAITEGFSVHEEFDDICIKEEEISDEDISDEVMKCHSKKSTLSVKEQEVKLPNNILSNSTNEQIKKSGKASICHKCPQCEFTTEKLQTLYDHAKEHPKKKCKCSKCNYETTNIRLFLSHVLKRHKKKGLRYKCFKCDFSTKLLQDLRNHRINHPDGDAYYCLQCNFETNDVGDLENHKNDSHNELQKYQCDKCNFSTYSKLSEEMHKLKHSEELLRCSQCDLLTTNTQTSLDINEETRSENQYECDICGFNAKCEHMFASHLDSHKDKYMCLKCNYSTNDDRSWRDHELFHEKKIKLTKLKCSLCEFATDRKWKINIHMKEHKFKCDHCDFFTGHKVEFMKHVKEHRYKCDHCNFSTGLKAKLLKHIKIHFLKHKCPVCDFKTKSNVTLAKHSKIHRIPIVDITKEEPEEKDVYIRKKNVEPFRYACSICLFGFSTVNEVKKHVKQHMVNDWFKCNLCIYQTKWYLEFSDHIKNKLHSSYKPNVFSEEPNKLEEQQIHPKSEAQEIHSNPEAQQANEVPKIQCETFEPICKVNNLEELDIKIEPLDI